MVEPDPAWPSSANLAYVEQMYDAYLDDPASVDEAWRGMFRAWGMEGGRPTRTTLRPRSLFNPASNPAGANGSVNGLAGRVLSGHGVIDVDPGTAEALVLQHRVDMLVRNYRVRGHIAAHLNPLAEPGELPPEMHPSHHGLTEADWDRPFAFTSTVPGDRIRTLRQIVDQLQHTYCGSIGVQFMHIDDLDVRRWLQLRMESTENRVELTRKEQIRILTRLTDAVIFEEFIQKKFIGAKSFSLEGGETLIPLLDLALERAGEQGVHEVVIAMAHRGRLNVLANILQKSPQRIFREFEDTDPERYLGGGDVKYHLGYSNQWHTRSGQDIHLSLCFNPSHLEYVNPVALGRLRAKQDRSGHDSRGDIGTCFLIHGDAAFAGEGVVQETLNLSQLDGYGTGGTVHIVVNNQIGFTTRPHDARSTRYATDIAKMLQVPIFHVNGEDPEAVTQVVRVAMDFRKQFKQDVIIDMYCYRRRGHNEGDEPTYTQPEMYARIKERSTVREVYLEHLKRLGGVSDGDAERIVERRTLLLEKELSAAKSEQNTPRSEAVSGLWEGYIGGREKHAPDPDTGVDPVRLAELLRLQAQTPKGFKLHPKLKRLLRLKEEMADGKRPLDWAAAESLAFATLATSGHRVRISGQDAQRGTFSHRHAVMHDYQTGEEYCPLQHLSEDQSPVNIFNSPLSEAGVLGFDFGYSLDYPCGLTVWEAQFGDFVNCAQVIIDQFISSAEDKWNRLSGIVMLLPHGFEGQGPEHSSARLERFLNQCAEDNMQVCNPTTPGQLYHLLRRQIVRKWRKPLIVMTPKSLLRHPRCVSTLDELSPGTAEAPRRFRRVLTDPVVGPGEAERILLCSGKVYYDLLARREQLDRRDVAILRLEQLYPFPVAELTAALEPYGDDAAVTWVQEEPRNMGAWQFLKGGYNYKLLNRWAMNRVARPTSASPATGSKAAHGIEQEKLMAQAFGDGRH